MSAQPLLRTTVERLRSLAVVVLQDPAELAFALDSVNVIILLESSVGNRALRKRRVAV